MNFTSQICTTREQSERLLALGLKKETADMCWTLRDSDREGNEYSVEYMSIGQGKYHLMHPDWYTPAWSLHRLLCLIPKEYRYDIDASQLFVNAMICSDPYTETIELIRLLLEDGYIYDEYLNA